MIRFLKNILSIAILTHLWAWLKRDRWGLAVVLGSCVYFSHQAYLAYADRIGDYSLLEESYAFLIIGGLLAVGLPAHRYWQRKRNMRLKKRFDKKSMLSESRRSKLMAPKKLRRAGDFIIEKESSRVHDDSESN